MSDSYKQYRSHKVVLATAILAIASITAVEAVKGAPGSEAGEGIPAVPPTPSSPASPAMFSYTLADQEAPFVVSVDDPMIGRYQPVVGDYLIVYPDGYRAFSPKAAFEDGYTSVDAGEAQGVTVTGNDRVNTPTVAPDPSAQVIVSSLDNIAGALGRIADAQSQMLEQARR